MIIDKNNINNIPKSTKSQNLTFKKYKNNNKIYFSLNELLVFLSIYFRIDYENFILKVS